MRISFALYFYQQSLALYGQWHILLPGELSISFCRNIFVWQSCLCKQDWLELNEPFVYNNNFQTAVTAYIATALENKAVYKYVKYNGEFTVSGNYYKGEPSGYRCI